jgi:hypothetical protein
MGKKIKKEKQPTTNYIEPQKEMNTHIPRGMKKKKVGGDVYRRRTLHTKNKRGKIPTNHFVGLCVYILTTCHSTLL